MSTWAKQVFAIIFFALLPFLLFHGRETPARRQFALMMRIMPSWARANGWQAGLGLARFGGRPLIITEQLSFQRERVKERGEGGRGFAPRKMRERGAVVLITGSFGRCGQTQAGAAGRLKLLIRLPNTEYVGVQAYATPKKRAFGYRDIPLQMIP